MPDLIRIYKKLFLVAVVALTPACAGMEFNLDPNNILPGNNYLQMQAGIHDKPISPQVPEPGAMLFRRRFRADSHTLYAAPVNPAKWDRFSFYRFPGPFDEMIRTAFYDREETTSDLSLFFLADYLCYPEGGDRIYYDSAGTRASLRKEVFPPVLLRLESDPPANAELIGLGMDTLPAWKVLAYSPGLSIHLSAPGHLARADHILLKPGKSLRFHWALLPAFDPEKGGMPDSLKRGFRLHKGLTVEEAANRREALLGFRHHAETLGDSLAGDYRARSPRDPQRAGESDAAYQRRLATWDSTLAALKRPVNSVLAATDSLIGLIDGWYPDRECLLDTVILDPARANLDTIASGFLGAELDFNFPSAPFPMHYAGTIECDRSQYLQLREAWRSSATIEATFWRGAVIQQGRTALNLGLKEVKVRMGNREFPVVPKNRGYPGVDSVSRRRGLERSGAVAKACLEPPCRVFCACHPAACWAAGAAALGAAAAGTFFALQPEPAAAGPAAPERRKYQIDVRFDDPAP